MTGEKKVLAVFWVKMRFCLSVVDVVCVCVCAGGVGVCGAVGGRCRRCDVALQESACYKENDREESPTHVFDV